jgi:hypothetical protein
MANVFTYKVLKDTTQKSVIKLTGLFDGLSGDEANTVRIQANSLYGALDSSRANLLSAVANTGALSYYGLGIEKLWFSSSNISDVSIVWSADTPIPAFRIHGNGIYNDAGGMMTICNEANGSANCTGDIGIITSSAGANGSYTIILELRKDNYDYQRGQLNDPAAFNYGDYSMRP